MQSNMKKNIENWIDNKKNYQNSDSPVKCIEITDIPKLVHIVENYIKIDDIEDNPIYAYDSIIEFSYFKSTDKYQGYFVFDKSDLRYKIFILAFNMKSENIVYGDIWNFENVSDLKIIDTVDKNRLKLIKDKK